MAPKQGGFSRCVETIGQAYQRGWMDAFNSLCDKRGIPEALQREYDRARSDFRAGGHPTKEDRKNRRKRA